MALISPGVQVTVIDESQYTPTAAGTIPFILLASAQDKTNPSGTTATGTTLANADEIITVTSQRDLVNQFGTPTFQLDASGNPINADELNEYGLLAAYSALGATNQVYIQRANVDLNQLQGTSIRPTGSPSNGTYWLDLSETNFGIYEWDETGFTLQNPLVITSTSQLSGTTPLSSVGQIGQYAVSAAYTSNQVYYKRYDNSWVQVGTTAWQSGVPTIVGQTANPTLTLGANLVINGNVVTISGGTTAAVAALDINGAGIAGVSANVNVAGQLVIYANSNSASLGVGHSADGKITIAKGSGTDAASQLGLFTSADGSANTKTLYAPTIQYSDYTNVPAWLSTDVTPRPYGSVWFKTSALGNGANWAVKEYSSTTDTWNLLPAPLYSSDTSAIQGLDFNGGGAGIAAGAIYIKTNYAGNVGSFQPFVKSVAGVTSVTSVVPSSTSFHGSDAFTMTVSVPESASTTSANIILPGLSNVTVTATTLVSTILSAGLPNVTAQVQASGAITISHLAGGTILFTKISGGTLANLSLGSSTQVQTLNAGIQWILSPWTPLTYSPSETAPYSNPLDGTLWYYSNPLDADILINDGTGWKNYRTVANDARGYNLQLTDPNGPILSASTPVTQSDGVTSVAAGDLWIDTSDLENFPVISRYNGSTWVSIDNTDSISTNGILFADARWSANCYATDGSANPITASLTPITTLVSGATVVLDPDAPEYQLYARGTLLFNTRRSGYNVKQFQSTAFANYTNPPTVTASWITHSGDDPTTGVPYFGSKAQRSVIVRAMKAAIAASTTLREEQTQFNLICAPGYPELIQDMVTLNNDRLNTAFIIGDSPLTLSSDSTTLNNWSDNASLAADNGDIGLVTHDDYAAVYYPSGLATNLDGNSVVVPASHMMLRTYIRSDNVAYPWFAPAGVRRGVIDNVSSIGYVDTTDNNVFKSIGVTQGLRDVLYTNEVNPITVLPGVGIVAYGQKTRASTTSAMDRVNVARLVCYLRLVLDKVAKPFVFEPNDAITRNQVKAAFEAVLNDVVAKRGIYDYLVVCDSTNNTPDRIDANELYVDIAIQPVKAIEFIYIPVRLENTGAALTIT